MKFLIIILMFYTVGCSTLCIENSLPAYFVTPGFGMGWSLKLDSDFSYRYSEWSCLSGSYSEGNWDRNGDTLILNSNPIPKITKIEKLDEGNCRILKVFVFGTDSNSYGINNLFYVRNDSLFPFIRESDYEMSVKNNFNLIYVFCKEKAQFLQNNFNCVIKIDDYDLNFTVKDTSADVIKIYLNDSREILSFDRKVFFKNKKFLLQGDMLFESYDNGKSFNREYSAIKKH